MGYLILYTKGVLALQKVLEIHPAFAFVGFAERSPDIMQRWAFERRLVPLAGGTELATHIFCI